MSEASKSDDQLQVPETENHLEAQDQVDKELQEIENNKITLGPEHLTTVKSMKKLASTYRKQNQFAEAAKLLEQVVAIQNTKLGEGHPSTLNNMSKIALLYIEHGNLLETLKLDIKVFEKKKLTLGLRDLSTLHAMQNVSYLICKAWSLRRERTDCAPASGPRRGSTIANISLGIKMENEPCFNVSRPAQARLCRKSGTRGYHYLSSILWYESPLNALVYGKACIYISISRSMVRCRGARKGDSENQRDCARRDTSGNS